MADVIQSSTDTIKRGYVKQVLSGDSIILQAPVTNGPPKEITVYLSYVNAPRLAKRSVYNSETTVDEPYAWKAREFLRKKIVGKTVVFVRDFIATSGREHGRVFLGGTNISNSENITEAGVEEGWLEVKPGKHEFVQKLNELQGQAKLKKVGRWSSEENSKHIRTVQWNINDLKSLVEKYKGIQIDAIVEQVRDGSTIRAFLLPSFEYVTIMLSGIKAPVVRVGNDSKSEEYGEQAKHFVESRLLQRDVKVILEGVSNQNFIGSVFHPCGNISEYLLKEGLAKIVEWSIVYASGGAAPLRNAEKYAKDHHLRLWKNYVSGSSFNKNSFTAKVIEIGLGDNLVIQKDNGEELKVYFSSFKSPRREISEVNAAKQQNKPLYDIPFLFEAREYLRKRLIGKTVTVFIDYIQPKLEQFPEKYFCTVLLNNLNIAEGLLTKGLGKIIYHKQDDENRSPHYDNLVTAESQAQKDNKGLWAKSDGSSKIIRVRELQGEIQHSKQLFPYLQRSKRLDGIVEFVASASRFRIYVPKESCIITFLLGGISCPRYVRFGPGGKSIGESEPFADEAYRFSKLKCLQHDVQIEVESMDKVGGFIGYLFIKNATGSYANLSEILVENGLATVHFTADRSCYYNSLISAERKAKEQRLNLWKDYLENNIELVKETQNNNAVERTINFKKVVVTEIFPGFRFALQIYDDGHLIESLMKNLQIDLNSNSVPTDIKRGQLAATKFQNLWHRVRVESIKNNKADVYYIDFGNRETVQLSNIVSLPLQFQNQAPSAKEYQLAFVSEPTDTEYAQDSLAAFESLAFGYPYLLLNVEYKTSTLEAASLFAEENEKKIDIGKTLVENGNALVEQRFEIRFKSIVSDYLQAEADARSARRNIWQYGDFTGNDI